MDRRVIKMKQEVQDVLENNILRFWLDEMFVCSFPTYLLRLPPFWGD